MIIIGLDVGIHNLSVCKIRRDSTNLIEEILGWQLVDCAEGKNATKISIEEAVKYVITTLDGMADFFFEGELDVFAIEAQPCGRIASSNIKMKIVSHAIQTWMMLRRPEVKTVFVNPKNKLTREYCGELLKLEGGDHAVKERYKKHKKMACDACTAILSSDKRLEKWEAFFQGHRKKDDLSDALLLAAVSERKKSRKRKKKSPASKKGGKKVASEEVNKKAQKEEEACSA